jgi:hypothetical protein
MGLVQISQNKAAKLRERLDDRERPLGDLMVAVIDWYLDGGHLKETLPQLPPPIEQERKPGMESPSTYSLAEANRKTRATKAYPRPRALDAFPYP